MIPLLCYSQIASVGSQIGADKGVKENWLTINLVNQSLLPTFVLQFVVTTKFDNRSCF